METLKFTIIEVGENVYISKGGHSYGPFGLDLLFDGVAGERTENKEWIRLPSPPKCVEKVVPERRTNYRYELKPEHSALPDMEATLSPCEAEDEDGEALGFVTKFYEYKTDIVAAHNQGVDFEIVNHVESAKYRPLSLAYAVKHGLIAEIECAPKLLPLEPCATDNKTLYKYIREQIKLRLDTKYSRITSDYDFCFTVEKVIHHAPVAYQADVSKMNAKKPKYVTRYRDNRSVKVFEMSPEGWHDHPLVPTFEAPNEVELQDKIEQFIDDLIKSLNRPMTDCPNCKGIGAIEGAL